MEWTSNVIASLQENVDCFPSSLAWLVRKIADMLSEVYGENSKEVCKLSFKIALLQNVQTFLLNNLGERGN